MIKALLCFSFTKATAAQPPTEADVTTQPGKYSTRKKYVNDCM